MKTIKSYSRYAFDYARKALICLALIGIGYLLGNAFPTFEVVPYGFQKTENYVKVGNEANKLATGCAPECEDFNDNVGG